MDEITKTFTGRIRKYLATIEAGTGELDSEAANGSALEKVRRAARQALREIHEFVAAGAKEQGQEQHRPHPATQGDAEAVHPQQPM